MQILLLDAPDFALFLGRFHPLVVHLPIGLLLLAGVMEFLARKPKYEALSPAITFTLFLGAISSIAAVVMGLLLAWGGGYDESTLGWHKWMGIAVAVIAIGLWVIKSREITVGKWLNGGLMLAMVLGLSYTGHLGGSLTHGSDYLFQYAPQPVRSLAGLPPRVKKERRQITNLDSAEVFADVVFPILDARCMSCHNPNKKKGDLLMTNYANLMKGGEGGDVILAGNSIKSELYHRVTMDQEDEDFMPPEGKKPLTEEQIEILDWWISEGAPEKTLVGEMATTEDIRATLAEELGLVAGSLTEQLAAGVDPVAEAVLADIRSEGFKAYPIAQDNPFIDVDFSLSDTTLSPKQLKTLLKAKEQILWLNLSRSNVSDADLEIIGQLPNLVRLRLDNTAISDEGVKYLSSLSNLEYLNLYGSKVGDASVETLKGMANLKKVFLWQTAVSESAANALSEARPELMVDTGIKVSEVVSPAKVSE